jgi:hypothetical protein
MLLFFNKIFKLIKLVFWNIISRVFQEGENVCQTKICLFGLADSMEKIRAFEQVCTYFIQLSFHFGLLSQIHWIAYWVT